MSDWLDGFYDEDTTRVSIAARTAETPARLVPTARISKAYIGIDPGLSGFLAVIGADGTLVEARRTPAINNASGHPGEYDQDGMLALARSWTGRVALALIEKQQPFRGQGPQGNFTLGEGYGFWKMALRAAVIPFEEIHPISWKTQMGIAAERTKATGVTKAYDEAYARRKTDPTAKAFCMEVEKARRSRQKDAKGRAVAKAQSLFPGYDLRATEGSSVLSPDKAESLLLATLARRRHLGNPD